MAAEKVAAAPAGRAPVAIGEALRSRFPVLEELTYLNSCSQGALSTHVRDAYREYLDGMDVHGSRWELWVERQDIVRGLVGELINADPAAVAVTASESAGVAALASCFDWSAGRDTVVTTEFEFPTIGQIWHAQERHGARVVHVAPDGDGLLTPDRFDAVIDERTAIVAVTQVCYRNGTRVELNPIIDLAHERGVPVLIDVYQALGTLPLDVQTTHADFVSGGFLKYLLGSPGAAFFYANPATTAHLVPTVTGWMAAKDIWQMDIHGYDPAGDARRFEAGTPPVPSLFAAAAGLELMLAVGLEQTWSHVESLVNRLRTGVEDLGGVVATARESFSAMLAVQVHDEAAAVAAMLEGDIVVSSRDGNMRIAAHCYNSIEDIDTVLAALARRRDLLR